MNSIVTRYGLMAGGLLIALTFVNEVVLGLGSNPKTLRIAEVVGYASILLSTSLIYFAVRRYRDLVLSGSIKFLKAFIVGLVTDFVASALYGLFMVGYFKWIMPDFAAQYMEMSRDRIRSSGLPAEEIARQLAQIDQQAAMYLDPLFQGLVMFATVFVIGAVVSAASAFVLKRKAS